MQKHNRVMGVPSRQKGGVGNELLRVLDTPWETRDEPAVQRDRKRKQGKVQG